VVADQDTGRNRRRLTAMLAENGILINSPGRSELTVAAFSELARASENRRPPFESCVTAQATPAAKMSLTLPRRSHRYG
jgi:hypothetical protein